MLEEQITKLNSSIIELTAVINLLWESSQATQPATSTTATKRTKVEKKPEPKKEPSSEPEAVTPTELEKMCLIIVRKNPDAKETIRAIIKAHGGDMIKDVPVDKLPELKAALEAL